jgi:hypothetical protein
MKMCIAKIASFFPWIIAAAAVIVAALLSQHEAQADTLLLSNIQRSAIMSYPANSTSGSPSYVFGVDVLAGSWKYYSGTSTSYSNSGSNNIFRFAFGAGTTPSYFSTPASPNPNQGGSETYPGMAVSAMAQLLVTSCYKNFIYALSDSTKSIQINIPAITLPTPIPASGNAFSSEITISIQGDNPSFVCAICNSGQCQVN